ARRCGAPVPATSARAAARPAAAADVGRRGGVTASRGGGAGDTAPPPLGVDTGSVVADPRPWSRPAGRSHDAGEVHGVLVEPTDGEVGLPGAGALPAELGDHGRRGVGYAREVGLGEHRVPLAD